MRPNWRNSPVTGRLSLGDNGVAEGPVALDLSLKASIHAVCQRCLQAFEMPLSTELSLLLEGPGETLEGQEGYEVWELSEDTVRLLDIVDEALTMAVPFAAMHVDDCAALEKEAASAGATNEEMTTPFASLRAQMDEDKQN